MTELATTALRVGLAEFHDLTLPLLGGPHLGRRALAFLDGERAAAMRGWVGEWLRLGGSRRSSRPLVPCKGRLPDQAPHRGGVPPAAFQLGIPAVKGRESDAHHAHHQAVGVEDRRPAEAGELHRFVEVVPQHVAVSPGHPAAARVLGAGLVPVLASHQLDALADSSEVLVKAKPRADKRGCGRVRTMITHARVCVRAGDREGLERLARYVLRGPLAKERIERRGEKVAIGLRREWSDGSSEILLSPAELCEKLAALVPRPRTNGVLYPVIFAANQRWRAEVVPKPPRERPGAEARDRDGGVRLREPTTRIGGRKEGDGRRFCVGVVGGRLGGCYSNTGHPSSLRRPRRGAVTPRRGGGG